jgi:effector-binding domain-containing protein
MLLLCDGRFAMALEEARYALLEKDSDFELRQYAPQILAETTVQGDFSEVGNVGFRRLFEYISGSNRKKQPVPMTAPVTQEATSEKISMTAPVGQESTGDSWSISFVMPAQYSLETLPEPLDSRVKLKEIPARTMAALKYSGTWSRKRYEKKNAELLTQIQKRGLKPIGEAVFARYNPPFMLWFMRRNEVLIPVELPPQ